ncbi:MAG: hypothetical protein ACR2P2_11870 [Nakamurella sp.]
MGGGEDAGLVVVGAMDLVGELGFAVVDRKDAVDETDDEVAVGVGLTEVDTLDVVDEVRVLKVGGVAAGALLEVQPERVSPAMSATTAAVSDLLSRRVGGALRLVSGRSSMWVITGLPLLD